MNLLSRDDFRNGVFLRDDYKCVICGERGIDAHHIIERRLWTDFGFYLDNGATLCSLHHIKAEETTLSCDEIRQACNIEKIILPEHLYDDYNYDKWGNIILPNETRLKGELFYDESVQKILKQGNVLNSFSKYVKYPRTYRLPWSVDTDKNMKDDRLMKNDDCFKGKEVVVTIKMDGENTSFYNDYIHARSLDSNSHPTRNWIKGFWSQINYLIDDNMRICGENLYAKHSIEYDNLLSYFYGFSIWTDNMCLSWKETEEYFTILNINPVEIIYKGIYNKNKIISIYEKYKNKNCEGYVIRNANEFSYADFRYNVGKFVEQGFKQVVNNSHGHWISKKIETNKLK